MAEQNQEANLQQQISSRLDPGEYLSQSWLRTEDLLKTHAVRRRNALKTLEDTAEYVMPDESINCRQDLLESLVVGAQRLSADKIQSTADPESKVIGIIESVDKQIVYSNESIRRRREQAKKEIQELDDLLECADLLQDANLRQIISNLYFCYEIETVNGVEVRKPVKYMTAAHMSGYSVSGHFEKLRKKAIREIDMMLMQKKWKIIRD